MQEHKQVSLSNLGLTINPERLGMAMAILGNHEVDVVLTFNKENGLHDWTLVLTDEALLIGLYMDLRFAIKDTRSEPPPSFENRLFLLEQDLATLEV